jgi:hypothetical protein
MPAPTLWLWVTRTVFALGLNAGELLMVEFRDDCPMWVVGAHARYLGSNYEAFHDAFKAGFLQPLSTQEALSAVPRAARLSLVA